MEKPPDFGPLIRLLRDALIVTAGILVFFVALIAWLS